MNMSDGRASEGEYISEVRELKAEIRALEGVVGALEHRTIRLEEIMSVVRPVVFGVVGLAVLTVFGALFAVVIRSPKG